MNVAAVAVINDAAVVNVAAVDNDAAVAVINVAAVALMTDHADRLSIQVGFKKDNVFLKLF